MSRFIVTADWFNNAPHLTAKAREELLSGIPAYQRDARTKGIPQLGAGVIYPILEDDILCDARAIPDHWPRGFGLDVGWRFTAAIWDAKDPDTGIVYRYDEHYRSEAPPEIHGAAIARRGKWVPGRIDPAAHQRKQDDGLKLMGLYRKAIYGEEVEDQQLLQPANNAVETGIYMELMALQQGMLKIMRGRCPNWLAQRRLYRRNERGEIIKTNDHALDAGRYRTASGDVWLAQRPAPVITHDPLARFGSGGNNHEGLGWMRNV